MHDSAFRIGEMVMHTYCDLPKARVLEIGSMDVNGSLRDAAEPTTHYVGVDLEAGPAVDVVVKPGEKLPFDDDSFDLVMASSAFEHDPRFWETFIEMCRVVQSGGHIYVNAPSNGGVHRYPLDCWRFYPDAGLALVDYARTQQVQVDLVESFVGKRYPETWDGWNDFVAVFRKGPSKAPLNTNFVYARYPSYNARRWNSSDMDCETSLTEDMQLNRDLQQQITEHDGQVEMVSSALQAQKDVLSAALGEARDKIDQLVKEQVEAENLRVKLAADLRISESEASYLRSAIPNLEQQVQALSSSLQVQADTVSRFTEERIEAQKIKDNLSADLKISRSEASRLRSVSESLERQVEALSSSLQAQTDAFARVQERDRGVIGSLEAEIAKLREDHSSYVIHASAELSNLRARETELRSALDSKNAQHERDRKGIQWLRALHMAMRDQPAWWSLLPDRSRRDREYEMLRKIGLFDDRSYLARYPDVASEGVDALDHYIAHGMRESRDRL